MTSVLKLGLMALLLTGSYTAMAQVPGSVMDLPPVEELDERMGISDNDDPCPEPRQALQNTPNDLRDIQSDITRFTLCLQRAQLLNRLNDLAKDNLETINSALDESMTEFMETVEMPAMPAMPQASVSAPAPVPMPQMNAVAQQSSPTVSNNYSMWSVREVLGRQSNLTAVLVDPMDNIVRVKKGDELPDGAIVNSVNATGVVVRNNAGQVNLDWVN